jgi:hypothetical protein
MKRSQIASTSEIENCQKSPWVLENFSLEEKEVNKRSTDDQVFLR